MDADVTWLDQRRDANAGRCCFCAERVPLHAAVTVELTPPAGFSGGSFQRLWTHADCLVDRLHPSIPHLWE